ncbi:TlpA disulfide reductase family protein [Actimicrobium antarcticum]|uniref:TlpA disulfide reductase family protein n=1 Tax=Actimicrobium antarcticum TaxID=1051899 RepID=A0ABP7TBS8_9BURK
MKRSTWLIVLVALLFAAGGAWFGLHRLAPTAPAAVAVTTLFGQSLPDMKEQPQALAQWRGKLLLVNFWATWCAPCVEEMPELSALQSDAGNNGLQIIGIGIDSPANLREFSIKHPVSYPLYAGGMGGSELTRQFGNQAGGLPFSVLISADGQVRKTYLGRLKMDELRRDISAK